MRSRSVVLLTAFVLLTAAAEGRAELRFQARSVNLGEVRSGAAVGHRFAFVNEGAQAVEIVEARPGCGCLRPALTQRVFAPGECGVIGVEVNARGQSAGPHTWRLQLLYRDGGTEREAALEVTAQVVTEMTIQPAALTLVAEGPLTQEVVLTDLRPHGLRVKEVATSAPYLHARAAEPYRDGLGHWIHKVRLEFSGGCPDGAHAETLTVYTDDPTYPDFQVPITVVKRPRGRMAATPNRVTFVLEPGQAMAFRLVRVGDRQGEKVVVESVTADDAAITCFWAPGPDNLATVKVQVERGRLHGTSLETAVHVRLSAPVQEILLLPIICTLEQAAP